MAKAAEPVARANAHDCHASCGAGGAPAVGVAHLNRSAHNPMTTEQRPRSIRRSLSLTIIVIGAFMLFVGVAAAIAKTEINPLRVVPSAACLILIGSVLYLYRASGEKKPKVDS